MRAPSWMTRLWVLSGIVLTALGVAVVVAMPAVAAYACPTCYGFKHIGDRLYVERSTTTQGISELRSAVAGAEIRARDFYGTSGPIPTLLVCETQACDHRLGGKGGKARVYGTKFIHVSPSGRNATVLAHELSHIEFQARIGLWRTITGAVPAWFDEGIAVVVARDDRYLEFDGENAPRCRHEPEVDLPTGRKEWRRQAGKGTRPLYVMAACRAQRWMSKNGGPRGLLSTLARIRAGGAFNE